MEKNYFLPVFLLSSLLLLCTIKSNAQLVILTPNDTAVCGPLTLHAAVTVTPSAVVNPVDDDYAPNTSPIGFTFSFYGVNYTRCLVSSNGYVSFNLADSGQGSAWSLTAAGGLPGNTACVNSICGVYEDIYLVNSGSIETYTVGAAPFRKFCVNFCSCPMFLPSLGCNDLETFQVVLYETTNNIEVHITNKHSCSAWNGGLAIEGVQNAAGTIGTPVAGRNNSVWTATNDAYRFVPSGATYTVSSIPYGPIPDVTPGTVYWYQGTTLLGTGLNYTVNPTGVTTYTALFPSTTCGNLDTVSAQVEILMAPGMILRARVTQPSTCGACDGEITLLGMTPNSIDSIHYMKNAIWQPVIPYHTAADSFGYIPALCAGIYDSIKATAGGCPSNILGPINLINPPIFAGFTDSISFGCKADTVLFKNLSSSPGAKTILYTWSYADSTYDTVTTPVHIYPKQGIYNVQLKISNTYCMDSITHPVNLRHALHSKFQLPEELLCQEQSFALTNNSTDTTRPNTAIDPTGNGVPPSYYWNFGDGYTDSTFSPTFAYNFNDTGSYNITLIVKDFVPCYDTSVSIVTVISKPHTYNMDSTFCSPNTTIPIGIVINNADSYKWSTGAITSTIIPDTEGVYTVTETNHCGTELSSVNVKLDDCDKCLFVPSAFTPNDDGLNDVFHARMLCPIRYYSMKIFNRYGQMVYTSVYLNQGWDGKFNGVPADIGTYLYEITYTPDLLNAHQLYRKGDITLVR